MIHILIADDDKYFRMALKELLSDQGVITEANNEKEAIELIHQNYFDIALVDMDIDGPKSGIRILKEARLKKAHTIVQVIAKKSLKKLISMDVIIFSLSFIINRI